MSGWPLLPAGLSAWNAAGLLLAAAGTALAWGAVPAAAVAIPARDGASSVLWPLVPVLVTVAVPPVLGCAERDAERAAARPQLALRCRALLGCAAVLVFAGLPGARFDLVVVARNTAVLAGVAALGCATRPAVAWVAVTLTPLTMWLLGTDPVSRQLAPWAVLLAPRADTVATVAAVTCAVLGSLAYLLRGYGPARWEPTSARRWRGSGTRRGAPPQPTSPARYG